MSYNFMAVPKITTKTHSIKKRILYICRPSVHYFKKLDYKILLEKYDVTRLFFSYSPLCIWKIFCYMRVHDVTFCWFGNIWAFFAVLFAKILHKKSIVVAGGHDVSGIPEIHYGLVQHPILKHFARYALSNADMVLPVSRKVECRLTTFARPRQVRMIYNALDCPNITNCMEKKKQVLTVGMVSRMSSLIKGHFIFVEVASLLPNIKFILYGQQKDKTIKILRAKATKNVQFVDHFDRDTIFGLYLESMIYAQFSLDESFGVAVGEAMAFGCTPVVSNRGALPEVIGETGYLVNPNNVNAIAKLLDKILSGPIETNERAIERSTIFSVERRRTELLNAVSKVI